MAKKIEAKEISIKGNKLDALSVKITSFGQNRH